MASPTALTASERRFRSLFHALDAENEWTALLTTAQLRYARHAAATGHTWLPFLAGVACESEGKDDVLNNFSSDDIWNLSALVRKRVTFAAIDRDFFEAQSGDAGLMPGDDGGYTDYSELLREERVARRESSGAFRLFAYQGTRVEDMPKPLFAGRVRGLLAAVEKLCKGNDTAKAIAKLVEMERNDAYDTVEECLTAIDGFVVDQREALGESCKDVETMVVDLRKDYAEFTTWHEETVKSNKQTEGVLGVAMPVIEDGENMTTMPSYDEESIAYRSQGGKVGVSVAKRPRVPIFSGEVPRKADERSLWDTLGPNNAVVKNLRLYERMNKLKKEMYRLEALKAGKAVKQEDEEVVPKPESQVIEILEDNPESGQSRPRAMGEACVSLLLSHTGFTHIDAPALDCLTDVFEEFLRDIGKQLIACRENIDNNAASAAAASGTPRTKTRDEMRVEREMVMGCVKGGFPELYNYVKADMMRTEQALREVEIRLNQRMRLLGGNRQDVVDEVIDGSGVVGEDDVVVGEELAFGYLGKRVWLDVLDRIRIPREMVFRSVKDEVQLMAIDT